MLTRFAVFGHVDVAVGSADVWEYAGSMLLHAFASCCLKRGSRSVHRPLYNRSGQAVDRLVCSIGSKYIATADLQTVSKCATNCT